MSREADSPMNKALGENNCKTTPAGQACAAREMTVEEYFDHKILQKQREVSELLKLKDSLPYDLRVMGLSKFERMALILFKRPHD